MHMLGRMHDSKTWFESYKPLLVEVPDTKDNKKSLGEETLKAFNEFATLLKHSFSQKASNGDGKI